MHGKEVDNMARERYLVHVSEEDLKPTESIGKPTTIKGKWQNFWYHYKVQTLIVGFVVAVAVLLVVQLVTREKYDYTLTVVTTGALPSETMDHLEAELLPFAQDIDGNGKKAVLINSIPLRAVGVADPHAGVQKLMTIIGSGDFMLFAVETDIYESRLKGILEEGGTFFRTLVTSDGQKIERWTWNASTAIKNADELEIFLTEDMVWFVRAASGAAAGEKNEKISDEHLQLLEAYMAAHAAENGT